MSEPTAREFESLTQAMRDLTQEMMRVRQEIAATYVRQDVFTEVVGGLRDDVKRHDDWLTWAQRIVLGVVLLAVLGVVIAQTGATG